MSETTQITPVRSRPARPFIAFLVNEARPKDSCLINNEIGEKVMNERVEVAIEFSILHQFDSFGIAITAKLFFQECRNQATFSKYLTCLRPIDGIRKVAFVHFVS